jgi:galactose oxidase-like protein
MQKTAVLTFAAALLLIAGCQVDPTSFRCTSSAECPSGYHCDLGTASAAATLKCANGAASQKTLAADASKFLLLKGPSPDGTVRTVITASAGAVTSTPDFIGVRVVASQGGADLADSQIATDGSVLAFQLPQATAQVSLRVQDDSGHSIPVTGYNQQIELGFEGKEVAGNTNQTGAYDVTTTSDSLYPPAAWISSGPGADGGVAPEFAATDTVLADGGVQSATSYASAAYLDFHQATTAFPSLTSDSSSIGWQEFAPIPTTLSTNVTPPARVGGTLSNIGGLVLYGGTTAAGGAVDTLGTFYTIDTLNGWTKVIPPAGVNSTPLGGAIAGVGLGFGGSFSCSGACTQFSLQFSMAGGITNTSGSMTSKVVAYGTRTDSTVTPTVVTTGWFDAGNLPLANAAMASAPATVPVSNSPTANTSDQYAGLLMVGGQAINTAVANDANGCLVYAGFASSPNTNLSRNTAFPCNDPNGSFVTASGGIGFRTGVTVVPVDSTTFLLFGGSKSGGTSGNGLKNDLWQGKLACNGAAGVPCTTQVTWTQLLPTGTPPSARTNAGGAIWQTTFTFTGFPFTININRRLVISGGTDASGVVNDLWEYDLPANAWRQVRQDAGSALAPVTRTRPMMAGDGARAYMFGGLISGTPTDQMWTTSRQGTARVLMKAPLGLPSIDTATGMKITVDGNGLTSATTTQGYLWDGSKWRFVGTGLQDAFGTRLVVSPTAPGTAFVQPDGNIYLLLQQAQRATTQFSGSPVGVDRLKMTVDFK